MATTKTSSKRPAATKPAKTIFKETGVIVPDRCQTCTALFSANVSVVLGQAKRVKVLLKTAKKNGKVVLDAAGNPVLKLTIGD